MRDFFIKIFTPIAKMIPQANPNMITWISVATGCLAGVAFFAAHLHSVFYLLGGLLVGLSGTCDSLDGIVARMYDRTSKYGDFLDHFFDRVINICIFIGLAFSPNANAIMGLFCLILVMLNSYLGTQIEASFRKRFYEGVGKAELFVGLALFTIVLATWPATYIPLGFARLSLVNGFFLVVGLLSLYSLTRRFKRVHLLLDEAEAEQS